MPFIKFEIHTQGTQPDTFARNVEMQGISLKDGMEKIVNDARKFMVDIISFSKKPAVGAPRKQNVLEDSIQVEKIGDGDYGIGNIEKMKREAPYWEIINYGATISDVRDEQYVRGSFQGGRFVYDPSKGSVELLPKGLGRIANSRNAGVPIIIKPMKYIETTHMWLNTITRVAFEEKLKKFRTFSN